MTQVAELLWYPLWDANIRLDHSVRTVPEALQVAGEDIAAGMAMLEARHIAGDARSSPACWSAAPAASGAPGSSRASTNSSSTPSPAGSAAAEIAHRAEPDLKCGRGGLRDVQLLNALAIAQLADVYPSHSWCRRPVRSAVPIWRC